MEKEPKVSVIIPTYNRKDYVTEAIDSVIAQTYKDFEIIVVDDGSTDGTGKMLKEKYGDKIRYFFKENGGCASARNYGIRMSQGKYVAFLDSDDKYLPEKLEDQVGILEQNNGIGFVYSDSYVLGGKKQILLESVRPDQNGSVAYALFMLTYMTNSTVIVRRESFAMSGYYDENMRYNEDTDFFLRLSLYCSAHYLKKPTLQYRIHEHGKSSNRSKLLEAVYFSSDKFLTQNPEFRRKIGRMADKRLGQIKLDLSMEYVVARNFPKALQELKLSSNHYPSFRKKIYLWIISSRIAQQSPIHKMVAFAEQILIRGLQWRIYKYTGWIL